MSPEDAEIMHNTIEDYLSVLQAKISGYTGPSIPCHRDKKFFNQLLTVLKEVFSDSKQIDYDFLAAKIMLRLEERANGGLVWERSTKYSSPSELSFLVKSMFDENELTQKTYTVVGNKYTNKTVFHPIPQWALKQVALTGNPERIKANHCELLRDQLTCLMEGQVHKLRSLEEAHAIGFETEYLWYRGLIDWMIKDIYSLLRLRAIAKFLKEGTAYVPETYIEASSILDPEYLPYQREAWMNTSKYLPIGRCVLETYYIDKEHYEFHPIVSVVSEQVFSQLHKEPFDWKYFTLKQADGVDFGEPVDIPFESIKSI